MVSELLHQRVQFGRPKTCSRYELLGNRAIKFFNVVELYASSLSNIGCITQTTTISGLNLVVISSISFRNLLIKSSRVGVF